MRPGEPAGPTDRKGSPPNRASILAIGPAEVNRQGHLVIQPPGAGGNSVAHGRVCVATGARRPPNSGEFRGHEGLLRCERSRTLMMSG